MKASQTKLHWVAAQFFSSHLILVLFSQSFPSCAFLPAPPVAKSSGNVLAMTTRPSRRKTWSGWPSRSWTGWRSCIGTMWCIWTWKWVRWEIIWWYRTVYSLEWRAKEIWFLLRNRGSFSVSQPSSHEESVGEEPHWAIMFSVMAPEVTIRSSVRFSFYMHLPN